MSEEKLMQILKEVAEGELDIEVAFDEIASRGQIDFQDPYEGE